MAEDYIPAKDGDALDWMQVYSAGISASPATFQLSTSDAAAIANAVAAFAAALGDVVDPAQRTPVTVAIKDEARVSATQICRQYATLIKFNAGISNPDKIAIGVRPVNPNRTQRNAPATSPIVNVVAATPGAQTVRYVDSMAPEVGAKPFGATQLQLFVTVGTAVSDDPDTARFVGAFTKNPITVGFTPTDDGKIATYWARWASQRGDTGPWSAPASMRIAA